MTQAPEQQSADSKPALYWPQLDGLRTLAFLLVFISHLEAPPSPQEDSPLRFLSIGWAVFSSWGWVGVELFFVLSAFLITTLLLQERQRYQAVSFKLFFIRRALRIWPLYFFFILLGFGLLPALGQLGLSWGDGQWQSMIKSYLGPYLLFLTNFALIWVPAQTMATTPFLVIPPFLAIPWSVAMEEQFYIVWGWILSRTGKLSTLIGIVLAGFGVSIALRGWLLYQATSHRAFYYNTFSHLDSLLIGIVLALLIFTERISASSARRFGGWWLGLPILFYGLLTVFAQPVQAQDGAMIWQFTLISVFSGLFLLGVLLGPGRLFFSHPFLVRIGRVTYGMYMFHMLACQYSATFTLSLVGQAKSLAEAYQIWFFYAFLGLVLTWVMAWASWHLLEKRFYKARLRFNRIASGFKAD